MTSPTDELGQILQELNSERCVHISGYDENGVLTISIDCSGSGSGVREILLRILVNQTAPGGIRLNLRGTDDPKVEAALRKQRKGAATRKREASEAVDLLVIAFERKVDLSAASREACKEIAGVLTAELSSEFPVLAQIFAALGGDPVAPLLDDGLVAHAVNQLSKLKVETKELIRTKAERLSKDGALPQVERGTWKQVERATRPSIIYKR